MLSMPRSFGLLLLLVCVLAAADSDARGKEPIPMEDSAVLAASLVQVVGGECVLIVEKGRFQRVISIGDRTIPNPGTLLTVRKICLDQGWITPLVSGQLIWQEFAAEVPGAAHSLFAAIAATGRPDEAILAIATEGGLSAYRLDLGSEVEALPRRLQGPLSPAGVDRVSANVASQPPKDVRDRIQGIRGLWAERRPESVMIGVVQEEELLRLEFDFDRDRWRTWDGEGEAFEHPANGG